MTFQPTPGVPSSGSWVKDSSGGYVPPNSVGQHRHTGAELDIVNGLLPAQSFGVPVDATASTNGIGSANTLNRSDHAHRGGIASVTSSTRPSSPYVGQTVYESDTGFLRAWNGSEWFLIGPRQLSWSRFSMSPTSTNSATYVDVVGWTDLSFTKRSTGSSLYITLSCGAYATVAGNNVDFGIRIHSTDADVCHFFFNDAGTHRAFSGAIGGFAGLAAGVYAARARWKTSSSQMNIDGNDLFSLRIEEF